MSSWLLMALSIALNTTEANSQRPFASLKSSYPAWESLKVANSWSHFTYGKSKQTPCGLGWGNPSCGLSKYGLYGTTQELSILRPLTSTSTGVIFRLRI
nr:PREDICTED: uncharacterized protein LOC104218193 isoform X2 [Nicotiana sylvestris]